MTTELEWVAACSAGDIEEEDVLRFDHTGQTYAIYHLRNGFFASDGWCTHERAHLADGLVLGDQIECPMHLGRFDIKTGDPLNPPVCKKLRLHPVRSSSDAERISPVDSLPFLFRWTGIVEFDPDRVPLTPDKEA